MIEQIVTWTAIVIMVIWLVTLVASQILYLVASFKASVGLTILSLFIPFVGLYVLVRFWEQLKRPFLNQVVVAFGGFALILIGGMTFKALGIAVPMAAAATEPEVVKKRPPAIQWIPAEPKPRPQPVLPDPNPPVPAWGTKVSVQDQASITIPLGWQDVSWELPGLGLAMGDPARGEYVTVHILDKDTSQSFDEFQEASLQEILQGMIEGQAPVESRRQMIHGCDVATRAMGGRSRLPDQEGQPMSARLSFIDGEQRRYYLVQWRNAAWDDQSVTTFDRLLASFAEIAGQAQP